MKALIFHSPYKLTVQDIAKPLPADKEILIQVKACGICGSDIHGYMGKTGRRKPNVIMGHEFTGIVTQTGNGATRFEIGQRVSVQPIIYCGKCEFCVNGQTNRCEQRECLGVLAVNGAMAEYICVSEQNVKMLPNTVGFVQGAVIEPLAVAYHAVSRYEVTGKSVLLVGAGPIGLLVLKILIARGARCVIVSDKSNYRLGIALDIGATAVVNPNIDDINEVVSRTTGSRNVDISIEAVGIGPTVDQSLTSLKNAGLCVWIGNSAKMIEMNMQQVVTRELNICGSYSYTDADFDCAIDLLGSGQLSVDDIIGNLITLHEAPAVFQSFAEGSDRPIKSIIVFD